jgi:hypothetical protein
MEGEAAGDELIEVSFIACASYFLGLDGTALGARGEKDLGDFGFIQIRKMFISLAQGFGGLIRTG